MPDPRPLIDVVRDNPYRPAVNTNIHAKLDPEIANSAIGLKIEASVRERLGECPNVKGDRPKESE